MRVCVRVCAGMSTYITACFKMLHVSYHNISHSTSYKKKTDTDPGMEHFHNTLSCLLFTLLSSQRHHMISEVSLMDVS